MLTALDVPASKTVRTHGISQYYGGLRYMLGTILFGDLACILIKTGEIL